MYDYIDMSNYDVPFNSSDLAFYSRIREMDDNTLNDYIKVRPIDDFSFLKMRYNGEEEIPRLSFVNFCVLTLEDRTFCNITIRKAEFCMSVIRKCKFIDVTFIECDFSEAFFNSDEETFKHSIFIGCNFSDAVSESVEGKSMTKTFISSKFSYCVLSKQIVLHKSCIVEDNKGYESP
jgi:hypothetical protein